LARDQPDVTSKMSDTTMPWDASKVMTPGLAFVKAFSAFTAP
jgi:hypothetical protein